METLRVKEKEEHEVKREEQRREQQIQEQVEEQTVTKEELLKPSNDIRRSYSSAKSDDEQAGTKDYELLKPSNDIRRSCSSAKSDDKEEEEEEVEEEEVGPRERLKRHKREVAGKVGIPERWGQESFLQEWIDCNAFDASLLNPHSILLARASLIRQQPSTLPLPLPLPSLPLENSC